MKKMLAKSVASLTIAACLSGAAIAGDNPNDPAEGWNRAMFSVNEVLDTAIAKPVAKGYDYVTPLPVKAVVGNFFSNIADVMIGMNNLLQGKPGDAVNDWGRVLVNTTIGIGGEGGALFPVEDPLGGVLWREVRADLDEPVLKGIASITGGRYFRADGPGSLRSVFLEIDRLEKRTIEEKKRRSVKELFPHLLAAALVLMMLEQALLSGRLRGVP